MLPFQERQRLRKMPKIRLEHKHGVSENPMPMRFRMAPPHARRQTNPHKRNAPRAFVRKKREET